MPPLLSHHHSWLEGEISHTIGYIIHNRYLVRRYPQRVLGETIHPNNISYHTLCKTEIWWDSTSKKYLVRQYLQIIFGTLYLKILFGEIVPVENVWWYSTSKWYLERQCLQIIYCETIPPNNISYHRVHYAKQKFGRLYLKILFRKTVPVENVWWDSTSKWYLVRQHLQIIFGRLYLKILFWKTVP